MSDEGYFHVEILAVEVPYADARDITFKSIKEELVLFFILTLFLLFISSVGIYYFENPAQPEVFKSVFHSLWWAVATFTTVGYGDIYPITAGGKVFSFFMLLKGITVV